MGISLDVEANRPSRFAHTLVECSCRRLWARGSHSTASAPALLRFSVLSGCPFVALRGRQLGSWSHRARPAQRSLQNWVTLKLRACPPAAWLSVPAATAGCRSTSTATLVAREAVTDLRHDQNECGRFCKSSAEVCRAVGVIVVIMGVRHAPLISRTAAIQSQPILRQKAAEGATMRKKDIIIRIVRSVMPPGESVNRSFD